MKKPLTYIFSLIISVFTVFAIIGTISLSVVKISVSESAAIKNIEKKHVSDLVYSQLEKYYNEKYYSSGIPADVYMGALKDDVIEDNMKFRIKSAFQRKEFSYEDMDFSGIENNLEKFFGSYAEENGIEKDEKYTERLDNAKDNAKKIISDYCDVYKIGTLKSQGLLDKLYKACDMLKTAFNAVLAAAAALVVLLILFNIKEISTSFYWLGISLIISGIIGCAPCIYLLSSDYFSSFTIKQPQIYMTYTCALSGMTKYFMLLSAAAAVSGVLSLVIYAVIAAKKRNYNPKVIK